MAADTVALTGKRNVEISGMHRRLAAVLTAEVVGFDRLVNEDEAAALDRVRRLRKDLVEPAVATHEGRIVGAMGNRLLAEFVSAVEAVRCAVEIQRALAAPDSAIAQAPPLRLRVGVNLGDVFSEGGDIRGDGVNIAEHLDQLAQPGGICITSTVLGQVRGRVDVAFEDLGQFDVENIPQPVHVFRILLDPDAARRQASDTDGAPWYRQWPMLVLVLAVLAFLFSAGLWLFARGPVIQPIAPERIDAPLPHRP